jgi:hypothetical protein
LGLQRLTGETNADYKQRLRDVFVHRSNSTLLGLIYGITRELGLEVFEGLRIIAKTDVDGNLLLPYGAIVFDEQNCTVYEDYSTDTVLETFDRFDRSAGAYYISELATLIQTTGYFNVEILANVESHFRSLCLYNQSTAGMVVAEDVATGGSRIKLAKTHLIPNTVSLRSPNLTEACSSNQSKTLWTILYRCTSGILYTTAAQPLARLFVMNM